MGRRGVSESRRFTPKLRGYAPLERGTPLRPIPSSVVATEQTFLDVIAGRRRGVAPSLARAALSAVERAYAGAMALRRRAYERGWRRSFDLDRPAISVGNLTVGGTGKTPVVRWLADRLRDAGRRPAVLTRGHGAVGGVSDEAAMLDALLNPPGGPGPRVPVVVDADRVRGAGRALAADPSVDAFLLDDGFQHRRARRAFDLVLVDATRPLGFDWPGDAAADDFQITPPPGRVLPRGLMREPASALSRADALLVTRSDRVSPDRLAAVVRSLGRLAPGVPVHRCRHAPAGYLDPAGKVVTPGGPAVAACGLGHPAEFFARVAADFDVRATRAFPDHHAYSEIDALSLATTAADHGAASVVVTEKDWVKIARLHRDLTIASEGGVTFVRAGVEIAFDGGDGDALLAAVMLRLDLPS